MTREQIEKVADDYSAEITPAYSNGYFERYQLADAFEAGAEWRINSVWHDASEMYDIRLPSVVVFKNGKAAIYPDLQDVTYDGLWDEVKEYAYLRDLRPSGKEGVE